MQLTVYIWPLPCEVIISLEKGEEEGISTALDLVVIFIEEWTDGALKELSRNSDVSIDDVSFAITRGKKLELLSNKPIFIIFTFFLGCIIVMLSLCCDGVVEVGTGSVVSCDGCEPTIMYFKWFNNRIC